MILEISKAFVRDVESLPNHSKKMILGVIREIQSAKNLHDIKDCSKLRGADDLYRIRMGNYRITFEYHGSSLVLKRALPRGKIYKKQNLR
jgi:mRNA-degrading endonuclease RelE of RelBE toxin-antitoxin system